MLLEVAISWISVVVLGIQVRGELREIPPQGYSSAITREVLVFGLPLIINKFGGFLFSRVDIFFVRSYLEATDVADYFLLLNLFDFPLRALSAYIFVLATDVAHEHGAGERASLLKRFYRAEGFGLLVGLGLSVAFFLASFLVPVILPEYGGTAQLMRLMSPLLVLKAVAQVASGGFMISLGRPRAMAALTLVGGALNVLLNMLLIPSYGTAGAVYATLIGHSAVGGFGVLYVYWGVRRIAEGK
jgi:O-antigen/teichoic acid export membrane protein